MPSKSIPLGNGLVARVDLGARDGSYAAIYREGKSGRRKRDKPILASIPIDGQGNIRRDQAIYRLMDVDQGDRKGKTRNAFVDIGIRAGTVAPQKAQSDAELALQFLWWMHPNESDLRKIDTPGSTLTVRPQGKGRQAAVAIIGTEKERKAVQAILNRNFTNAERRLMNGLLIEIGNTGWSGAAGTYQNAKIGNRSFDKIVVGKKWLFHEPDKHGPRAGDDIYDETLTHELVHHLRYRDPRRQDVMTRRAAAFGSVEDRDLEETMTDAETLTRMRIAPNRKRAGYYPFIRPRKDLPTEQGQLQVHDKQLLMGVVKNGKPKIRPSAMSMEIYYERELANPGADSPYVEPGQREKSLAAAGFSRSRADASHKPDRHRTVHRMFDGRRGVNAIKAVDRTYPNLAISKARIHGKSEAVDTYMRYKGETQEGVKATVDTHIFSPRADITPEAARSLATTFPLEKGKLTEFRDGKQVKSRVPRDRNFRTPRHRI